MELIAAFSLICYSGYAAAFWRMECRGLPGINLARIDPIMWPGQVASHVHTYQGSAGFGLDCSYQDLVNADCTSCLVTEDKSAYWTPALYFQYANGSFTLVDQVGGMLAYYFLNGNNITAFPEGFRMVSGDNTRRNYSISSKKDASAFFEHDPGKSLWIQYGQTSQKDLAQRAIGFNCLDYSKKAEGSLYRHFLPDKNYLSNNCPQGIRVELMFPSCWDGKNLDSPNHRDHVAFSNLVIDGECPEGFPIRIPGLFFETIWDTYAFKDEQGQFVFSNGDVQGYGYHGDYMMGWKPDFLQQAVNTCTDTSGRIEDCPIFNKYLQPLESAQMCAFQKPAALANEIDFGMIGPALPGGVFIQYGPEPALLSTPPKSKPLSTQGVPTLSYSAGRAPIGSDFSIGDIIKQQASPTSSSRPTTPAKVGSVTPSPNLADSLNLPEIIILSTGYVTANNVVSEIVYEETIIYVKERKERKARREHLRRHADGRRGRVLGA